MNVKFLPAINSAAFVGVLTVNALANILPINGMNTGEVSALYPSLFTPAGFTFSIWSVIYLFLAGFVVVQWRWKEKPVFKELSSWFLISCAANASWIIAWHYLYIYTSVAIMLVLLISLIKLFLLLQSQTFSAIENVFIKITFSIYFSWICVATIANLSALLISVQWSGGPLSAVAWTVILILIAAALSVFITLTYNVPAYSLVTMWALFGIYSRWADSDQPFITKTAFVSMLVLVLTWLYTVIRMYAFRKINREL
jgi:benzodiazapine receptor